MAVLSIKPYQIPRLYQQLEQLGVTSQPPRSDFEAYRGILAPFGWVVIQIDGTITHSDDRQMVEQIELALNELDQSPAPDSGDRHSQYMILARQPISSATHLQVNHLNIWLNASQFAHALDLLQDDPTIRQVVPTFDFELHKFESQGSTISFHDNGKVIAEDGYSIFAPMLSQAIALHLPYQDYGLIIGQDEVGTGERIGPLVIGAVAATPTQLVDLQLAGIKDSKMVPRGLTAVMNGWIRDIATQTRSYQLEPVSFNQQVVGERKRPTQIVTDSHNQAVEMMKQRLRQYGQTHDKMIYLVDQYHRYERLASLEDDDSFDCEVVYLPGAEQQSVSVAAASIVAKSGRYRWIRVHEKVYGIRLKRKRIKQLARHERAHELLKLV